MTDTIEHLPDAIGAIEAEVIEKAAEISKSMSDMSLLKARRHDLHERYAALCRKGAA
jgi:hypothetical protein